MVSRRQYAAALLAGFAGCAGTGSPSGRGSNGTGDETANDASTEPTESPPTLAPGESHDADGYAVTVSTVGVRHGIAKFGTVHVDPFWTDGAQFLVVDVAVSGDSPPDPADVPVSVAADTLSSSPDRYLVAAETNAETRQRLAFVVPTDPAPSRAVVTFDGAKARWRVPDDAMTALGRTPSFEIESVSVPDTAAPDTEFPVDLTVTNAGERSGRFLAEVGNGAISDQPEVTTDVPVGESVTVTRSVDASFGESETLTVVVRWEGGVIERTVGRR